MNQLYSFLSRIQKNNLRVAPFTKKATWVAGQGSPYKVIMVTAVLYGRRKNAFKNGLITIEQIRPFFSKLAALLLPAAKIEDSMLVQPFWYLGAGQPKIWDLIPAEGASDELIKAMVDRRQIKTMTALKSLVSGAELSTPDFELLSDPLAARTIVRFIAGEYFYHHPSLRTFLSLILE
jgi:hypothetical protein